MCLKSFGTFEKLLDQVACIHNAAILGNTARERSSGQPVCPKAVLSILLGSLSKDDNYSYEKVTKQWVVLAKQKHCMHCTCVSHFDTFLCCSCLDNDME